MKVFTYGTLMRGYGNNRVMQEAKGMFVGEALIKDKDIYFAYQNSFPAVVDGKGVVYGEVWEVPEKNIAFIDQLEGYYKETPKNSMYLRKKAQATLRNGIKVWVSYYYWNRKVDPKLKIPSGRWSRVET